MTDTGQQTILKTEANNGEQIQFDVVESINLDNFEIVSAEFFAQIKEPAFTVNVNKVTPNAAAVRMLPDVDYVKMLLDREEKRLVLMPCDEFDLDGYKWAKIKDGRRYASHRTGEIFVLIICNLMGWNPDYRYKIMGKKYNSNGVDVLVFDLSVKQTFEKPAPGEKGKRSRRAIMPAGWDGSFGPKFGEGNRTLKVDTFAGYTVFSVKDNKKKKPAGPETESSGHNEDEKSEAAGKTDENEKTNPEQIVDIKVQGKDEPQERTGKAETDAVKSQGDEES